MDDDDWITDANGNRCSIVYWGSRKAAEAALMSALQSEDREANDMAMTPNWSIMR